VFIGFRAKYITLCLGYRRSNQRLISCLGICK